MWLLLRENYPATLLSAAAADTTWCIRDGCYDYVILLKIKLLFSAKNQPWQVKVKMLVLIFLSGSGKTSSLNNFKTQPQAGRSVCVKIHYLCIHLKELLKWVQFDMHKITFKPCIVQIYIIRPNPFKDKQQKSEEKTLNELIWRDMKSN